MAPSTNTSTMALTAIAAAATVAAAMVAAAAALARAEVLKSGGNSSDAAVAGAEVGSNCACSVL